MTDTPADEISFSVAPFAMELSDSQQVVLKLDSAQGDKDSIIADIVQISTDNASTDSVISISSETSNDESVPIFQEEVTLPDHHYTVSDMLLPAITVDEDLLETSSSDVVVLKASNDKEHGVKANIGRDFSVELNAMTLLKEKQSFVANSSFIDLTGSDSQKPIPTLEKHFDLAVLKESDNKAQDVEENIDLTVCDSQEYIVTLDENSGERLDDDNFHLFGPVTKRQKVEHLHGEEINLTCDTEALKEMQETEAPTLQGYISHSIFSFNRPPKQLTGAWKCFDRDDINNYLRGCKWAPDGTCLMSNSNDNVIRVFNLPEQLYYDGGENAEIAELVPVLKIKEADTIYDYCWFPTMSSSKPETACLAVSSKDTPVHLYDAFSGDLRCSYRAYNHVDEIVAAHCIEFSLDGEKLYCGFNKMIRVFDVRRPGREFENRPTFAKEGQRGIISCISHSPSELGLYAAGSYSRSIALYEEPAGAMVCMFEGQQGGVTQIKFSPDGTKLYSGGRKDNEILCWDIRNPGQILFTVHRKVVTNQRIYFDISSDGQFLVSGSHDGTVQVWDTNTPPETNSVLTDPVLLPKVIFEAHSDTVNGISLHTSLPIIATTSGQRHFKLFGDGDDLDDSNSELRESVTDPIDNSLRLWWT